MKDTDREGQLFEAICEAPDDDEPRLVYADLLQQLGDPRGEFIQVQCALAKDPTNRNARVVENKLLAAHGASWKLDVETVMPELSLAHLELEFRRGFIAHATIGLSALRHACMLVQAAPLVRSLRVVPGLALGEYASVSDLPIAGFDEPALARMTELELSLPGTGNRLVTAVASGALRGLRKLAIRASVWGEAASYYRGNPADLAVDAEGAARLASSPTLAGVTELAIDQNRIGRDGLAAIANGRWRLTSLDAGENAIEGLGDALRGPATAGLRTLGLAHALLDDDDLTWLASRLPTLRDLDLERCGIGAKGIAVLCDALAVPLERLRVERNSLCDAGAATIAGCAALASLRELEMGHNRMGHKAALALASSPHLARLERLTLSEPRWKDDTKAVIAASETLARTKVYLAGKLIGRDAKKAAAALPRTSRRGGSRRA